MYAQIITTKVSENANSGVVKWCGWQSLGKVVTLAGVIREGFLGEVLFGWIEGCEDVWDPGGRWQDKVPPAYYQRVHTGGWMALGVPILVLICDLPPQGGNIFLGVAAGRLAGWKHRQKEQRERGHQDEKIGKRRQDIGERVEGWRPEQELQTHLRRALALSDPLALGLQFLLSTGREMKKCRNIPAGWNLGELPIYPITLQARELRARDAVFAEVPEFESRLVG